MAELIERRRASRTPKSAGGAGTLAELTARLADLERAARAAEGRDDDLAGLVAGLNRAFGARAR